MENLRNDTPDAMGNIARKVSCVTPLFAVHQMLHVDKIPRILEQCPHIGFADKARAENDNYRPGDFSAHIHAPPSPGASYFPLSLPEQKKRKNGSETGHQESEKLMGSVAFMKIFL